VHLDRLFAELAPAFKSQADHARAQMFLLAGLLNLGRHTFTGSLTTAGQQHQDWSAAYRSLRRLPVDAVFDHVRRHTLGLSDGPWVVALDDTATRKTGRRIPGCGWRRDPLSPPFQTNLHWGQRILQFSAAIPADDGSARLVPIDWQEAPVPRRPRQADAAALDAYREACRQANLNTVALQRIGQLRTCTERAIHLVGDGRYTNRAILRHLPEKTVLIGRIRKDTKLHALCSPWPGQNGRPRRYGTALPNPEALRTDEAQPWITVSAWAVDRRHNFRVKTLGPVLAPVAGVDRPVRIVVIAPVGYRLRQGGKLLYRQPAYLICTDPELPLAAIVQQYLWRWDIEVNIRDEKCLLGVSEAQLRQPQAVRRQPAAAVAAYALLLLAALKTYGATGQPTTVPPPRWRTRVPPRRATTSQLLAQLRIELWSRCLRSDSLSHFRSRSPSDQNRPKPTHNLADAVFYARN
jgi:hypothetical protein